MLSVSKHGTRNKITLAVVSLRTIMTFIHPTLCTLCVQWTAKRAFIRVSPVALLVPSPCQAQTHADIVELVAVCLFCLVTNSSKIAWFNKHFNNHQHRPSFKAPESYHPHSITIIHLASKLNNQQPTLNRHNESVITHQASIIKHHSSTNNDLPSLTNHQSTFTRHYSSPFSHFFPRLPIELVAWSVI